MSPAETIVDTMKPKSKFASAAAAWVNQLGQPIDLFARKSESAARWQQPPPTTWLKAFFAAWLGA